LTRFAQNVDIEDEIEGLPARMSRLLAQGTGAQWAQVWLQMSGRLTLAGRWPLEAADDDTAPVLPVPSGVTAAATDGRRTLPVHHGHQVLGVLRLQERPGLPLTAVEQRLFAGLAHQAGLVLKLAGLRAELEDRRRDLAARTHELEDSRSRVIEAQDAERSRLERDIHDGAQQHLVALALNLRLAQVLAARTPGGEGRVLGDQVDAARQAIETLSSLSRGIYPRMLSEQGLVEALRSGLGASAIPVTVEADGSGRPPALLEAAFYFCGMEAVQNAAKHSGAARVTVRLRHDDERWSLDVTDDGSGFDHERTLADGAGVGLMNMRDRLDAVDGTVTVTSLPGAGTTVSAIGPARHEGG
jgi:signal transduction histidine kinase